MPPSSLVGHLGWKSSNGSPTPRSSTPLLRLSSPLLTHQTSTVESSRAYHPRLTSGTYGGEFNQLHHSSLFRLLQGRVQLIPAPLTVWTPSGEGSSDSHSLLLSGSCRGKSHFFLSLSSHFFFNLIRKKKKIIMIIIILNCYL